MLHRTTTQTYMAIQSFFLIFNILYLLSGTSYTIFILFKYIIFFLGETYEQSSLFKKHKTNVNSHNTSYGLCTNESGI